MATVYTIASNYNGQQHSVDFFPSGYGHSYDGYITTFEQFQDELNETFDTSSFTVMYISQSCEMKEIEDDHDLFRAAEELEDGACLSVTLFDGYRRRRKSTKKNKKESWHGYFSESDMATKDSSSSSSS